MLHDKENLIKKSCRESGFKFKNEMATLAKEAPDAVSIYYNQEKFGIDVTTSEGMEAHSKIIKDYLLGI